MTRLSTIGSAASSDVALPLTCDQNFHQWPLIIWSWNSFLTILRKYEFFITLTQFYINISSQATFKVVSLQPLPPFILPYHVPFN